ncbi:MAG TPA: PQQ-dependent sugar dehydrogenase [Thermoleophilaceae bacterium]
MSACGGHDSGAQTGATTAAQSGAQTAAHMHLVKVGSFSSPIYVAAPKGDTKRVFVVERAGRIVIVSGGHKLGRPFLDVRSKVSGGGERGLLSMAFAPDYATSGHFYVDYTDTTGDIRVVQYTRSSNPDRALAGSGRSIIRIEHSQFSNHNGGQLEFGPDGMLYIGVGDGGSEDDPNNTGQNLGTLLGKILRIDPHPGGGYGIPSGNPFNGAGQRREIYAYGLRNPWRFSFDSANGALVIGDVGQNKYEEIDYEKKGAALGRNFGWSHFEGFSRFKSGATPNYAPPVLVRSHSGNGFCAIVGGYVVRDHSLGGLYGRYVYGDDCNTGLFSVRLSPGHASGNRSTGLHVNTLDSFGVDGRGRIYAVSLNGPVYRLAG